MNKCTKHKSFTALVLEIRASLYLTDSGAILQASFVNFLKLTESLKLDDRCLYFLYDTIQHRATF